MAKARKSSRISKRNQTLKTPSPSPQTTPKKAPPAPKRVKKTTAAPSTLTPCNKTAAPSTPTPCSKSAAPKTCGGVHRAPTVSKPAPPKRRCGIYISRPTPSKKQPLTPSKKQPPGASFTYVPWGSDPERILRRGKASKAYQNAQRASVRETMWDRGGRVTRSQAYNGQQIWLMKQQECQALVQDEWDMGMNCEGEMDEGDVAICG